MLHIVAWPNGFRFEKFDRGGFNVDVFVCLAACLHMFAGHQKIMNSLT